MERRARRSTGLLREAAPSRSGRVRRLFVLQRTTLLAFVVSLSSPAAAGPPDGDPRPAPEPCAPAHVTSDVTSLPEAWRRALDALVETSAREGLPWSCSSARVALSPPGGGAPARLTIAMDGWPAMERDVERPEDLVPAGEALLTRPPGRRAPAPAPATPPTSAAPPALAPAPAPAPAAAPPPALAPAPLEAPRLILHRPPPVPYIEPRLLVDTLVYSRYSGGMRAFWMGAELRATVPIEGWSVGIWGRYELAVADLQSVPYDFSVSSGSIGVSVGRRIIPRPIDLWAMLEPSVAIVSMDGGLDGSPQDASGAKGDVRVGARLQGSIWFGPRWRGLLALDGEVSPWTLASEKHRLIDPRLPQMPSFTLGASFGGEIAIR
jgi:hypothetical protein